MEAFWQQAPSPPAPFVLVGLRADAAGVSVNGETTW
jgi:hypothetical protein